MKTSRYLIILLCLIITPFACDNYDSEVNSNLQLNETTTTIEVDYAIMGDVLNKVLNDVEVASVSDFSQVHARINFIMLNDYGIDVTATQEKLSGLGGIWSLTNSPSTRILKDDELFDDAVEFLNQLDYSDYAWSYVERIRESIPEETQVDSADYQSIEEINAYVISGLDNLSNEINSDELLSIPEKESLLASVEIINVNLDALYDAAEDIPANGKCRFFCKAWRKIKSVIVHVAVGAGSGFIVGNTFGAIVGGIGGGVFGIFLAAGNYCLNLKCSSSYMECDTRKCQGGTP